MKNIKINVIPPKEIHPQENNEIASINNLSISGISKIEESNFSIDGFKEIFGKENNKKKNILMQATFHIKMNSDIQFYKNLN